ncbi:glutamine amidotransferase [Amycolatopsis sp. GM8]|uniref:glutamine amidotransferase n=1 Tax=Amycolatopsis sp. GM8 TaxID=2896530 RepID=UPI001F3E1073|nr:glutamine amidotransferase [Amycolatopsis sp. GM8]
MLLIGESWFIHSVHQKGFDSFTTSEYEEGGQEFLAALRRSGHDVSHMPAHRIESDFPRSVEALNGIADVVVISDVGANSFLLSRATFVRSIPEPDRISILSEFVDGGGGLLMVGGYMTFAGIDGRARWGETSLASALPVTVRTRDDRVEVPAGLVPTVAAAHPIVSALDEKWPPLLGLNEVEARESAETLAVAGEYPLLVVGTSGQGRTAAFTSDLAPHWATPDFLEWAGYEPLFDRTIRWLSGELTS